MNYSRASSMVLSAAIALAFFGIIVYVMMSPLDTLSGPSSMLVTSILGYLSGLLNAVLHNFFRRDRDDGDRWCRDRGDGDRGDGARWPTAADDGERRVGE